MMAMSKLCRFQRGWRRFAAWSVSWLATLATVAGLVAVGWLGHATHWSFGLLGHDAGHGSTAQVPVVQTESHVQGRASDAEIVFPSREAVERSGIATVPVQRRTLVSEIPATGVVRYDDRRLARLSSRVSGSVWRVEKRLGDRVATGDVLLIVESSDVGRLKAEFLNALVELEAKREQLAILEEVKGAVMGRQLREAKAACRQAGNQLMHAEQALVNLGFDVSAAAFEPLDDETRAARMRTLGLDPEVLVGRDSRQLTSNLIPLRAPFAGIVIGRDATVGEVVDAGREIFEIADVSTMWVMLSIAKEDASRVAIGQTVHFRPDGAEQSCTSTISWISTEVSEASRALQVRIDIGGPQAVGLRANAFGTGRIEVARVEDATVVPNESLQWDGKRWVVFVPAGDAAFRPQPVEVGLRQGNLVEIHGDFAAGPPAHVVGPGSHLLKSKILLDRVESGEL
jgi:cobalt-zinc-cadmium efflux system membrane fusion protein